MSKFLGDFDLNIQKSKSETFKLSNNTKRFINDKINKDMKLNFTEFIKLYQIDIKNEKYFKEYLSEISEELISISHKKKGISKYIFIKYFNLPGLICRRLFAVFNNNINEEEFLIEENFIQNMLNLYIGNIDYLFEFIFKLFDFNNDGNISYEEVSLILSYIPIRHNNYDSKKFKFEQDKFIDRIQTQEEISLALKLIFEAKSFISYNEFVDIIKNKTSDIFIFLLVFILERKPFTKEIIDLYKDENISEEEEESDYEDNKTLKNEVFIKSPILKDDKIKTPQITKKKIFLNNKKKPLNNPIVVNETNFKNIYKNNNSQKYFNLANEINKNYNLHNSKSDIKINHLNKKHKEGDKIIIETKNKGIISKINFIRIEENENKLFSMKRKSKFKVKIKKKYNYNNVNSYWNLTHFKLNDISDIENNTGSEESQKSSIPTDSDNENDISKDINNNLELSDKNLIKEGYLYKLSSNGKIKKMLVKLINNHLFYFKDENSSHFGIDCLIRVFIKESFSREINGKYYYCFILIFKKKEKEFLIDNEDDYKLWLKIFKKVLHCEDINELYDIQNKIGEGRFAHVYNGIHKSSQRKVAIKILEKDNLSSSEMNMIQNEIEILKLCQHPNILKLYDVIENHEKIYIITELIEGLDLFTYLEKNNFDIDEIKANKIIKKLTSALFYLNIFGIVHRDIKPENILLSSTSQKYNIKLIDFGLGIILGPDEKSEQPFGTVSYVAPEVLCGQKYDKSVDIWSIGILTYVLLVGKLPFDDSNDDENEIARQTINDPPPFIEEKWNNISNEAKDFVGKCLEKDPKNRINITEILNHKWLKKYISDKEKYKENKLERLPSFEILKILSPNEINES